MQYFSGKIICQTIIIKNGATMLGTLDFDSGIRLSTAHTGFRVSLWYDNVNVYDWYDFI